MKRSSRSSTWRCVTSPRNGPCLFVIGSQHSTALPWNVQRDFPNDQKATYTKELTDSQADSVSDDYHHPPADALIPLLPSFQHTTSSSRTNLSGEFEMEPDQVVGSCCHCQMFSSTQR